MNIYGVCKECGNNVELAKCEISDCIYECPVCGHPHTLGEFTYLEDMPLPGIPAIITDTPIEIVPLYNYKLAQFQPVIVDTPTKTWRNWFHIGKK